MARPWLPVGFLPVRPSDAVEGAVQAEVDPDADIPRPAMWLVLIPGREYRMQEVDGQWVVSVR